jgi:lactam utilization protein B
MQISPEDMWGYWTYQLGARGAFANAEGARLYHAKPHGALYSLYGGGPSAGGWPRWRQKAHDPQMHVYFPASLSPAIVAAAQVVSVHLVGELYVGLQSIQRGGPGHRRARQARG